MIVRFGAALCGGALMLSVVSSAALAEAGIASFYRLDGNKTANGEIANSNGFTAAHKTLPFGTHVRVTNERNKRSVVVRINDRGPFIKGRIIDLTPAGAKVLGFSGITKVTLAIEKIAAAASQRRRTKA